MLKNAARFGVKCMIRQPTASNIILKMVFEMHLNGRVPPNRIMSMKISKCHQKY